MIVGGSQRVLANLANELSRRGYNVKIIDLSNKELFFPIHNSVKIIKLGIKTIGSNPVESIYLNIKRINILRRRFKKEKPDVVISFLTKVNILTTIASRFLNIPVIISERNNPRKDKVIRLWDLFRSVIYKKADLLVTQTDRIKKYYEKKGIKKIKVIHNPVTIFEIVEEKKRKNIIISVGSLTRQKGYDLLLHAFLSVKDKAWKLNIVGDGLLKAQLTKLSHELLCQDRVIFSGKQKNMKKYYGEAKIYVLSSRYEGFPNVLCEAMAAGLPCIAFDCPTGPREIINNGINGILVENGNVAALAKAINTLIDDENMRNRLGKQALHIRKDLDIGKITEEWEAVIKTVCEQNRREW